MEYNGTFDITEMNLKIMNFMLYIVSRDLLPYNQLDICISINNP